METKVEEKKQRSALGGFRLFGSSCTCKQEETVGSIVVGNAREQAQFTVKKCRTCGMSRFETTRTKTYEHSRSS